MTKHNDSHPLAHSQVQVQFKGGHPQVPGSDTGPVNFDLEDWWDTLTGKSWMYSDGNPAAIVYAMRSGMAGLPTDDEVVYGKVGGFGHLVHTSELVLTAQQEEDMHHDPATENKNWWEL